MTRGEQGPAHKGSLKWCEAHILFCRNGESLLTGTSLAARGGCAEGTGWGQGEHLGGLATFQAEDRLLTKRGIRRPGRAGPINNFLSPLKGTWGVDNLTRGLSMQPGNFPFFWETLKLIPLFLSTWCCCRAPVAWIGRMCVGWGREFILGGYSAASLSTGSELASGQRSSTIAPLWPPHSQCAPGVKGEVAPRAVLGSKMSDCA